MRRIRWSLALALMVAGATAAQGERQAQQQAQQAVKHVVVTPNQIRWQAAPAVLPQGAQIAVLEGDPSKAGPFTVRLKAPAGYRIAPHSHPGIEHVTVISGTFNIGMGDTLDTSKGQALPAGSFIVLPPGMHHYAWATSDAVVQLHGVGPWELNYVNPDDDPRNR